MIRKFGVFLAALALIAGFGLTGCDSWMSGDHFFDTIADEVKYANAEVIPVYVRYPTSTWGSTSPNGRSSQKVDIPFTVTAVDNNEYGFYKWAAFSTSVYRTSYGRYNVQLVDSEEAFDTEYADEMLGEDEVVFEDPYSPSTTVRVLSDRDDVFIMPICVKRPVLQDSLPTQNQTGATKNTTIQLVFSNAMDPKYLLVQDDGTELTDGYTGTTYLNTDYVMVEQIMAGGKHPFYLNITTRLRDEDNHSYTTPNVTTPEGQNILLLPASLNTSGRTLTIRLPSDEAYWPNGTILVTISQDVKDKLGYTMPNDDELVFGAGDDEDTITPKVLGLEIGTTSLISNASDNYPRVGKNPNIRAYLTDKTKDSESPSEGNVNLVKYILDRYNYYAGYPSLPTSVAGVDNSFTRVTDGQSTYAPSVNFTDASGTYPKAVVSSSLGTVFQVDLSSVSDEGLFKLYAYGVDNVGNTGSTATPVLSINNSDAECKYVVFIRDITPPDAAECAGNISSANNTYAPYGWYGSEGLGHIQLKEASAGAIKDYTQSGRDPKYSSNKVWWAFYLGSGSDAWVTDMQKPENAWDSSKWMEVSATSTQLSTLLGHDIDTSSITEGNVSVYAVFKDDVGNVSSKAEVNAVKFDGTAPQMGTLSWITPADVPMGFTGHAKIDNHTLAIPFTESLSGIKKIAIEVVPPGGGAAYKQAFSDANFAIKRKNSSTYDTYETVTFVKSPATPATPVAEQNVVIGSTTSTVSDSDFSLKSSTSSTYQNAIYLDNLKIAAEDAALVEGNYTIKVKLYDAALNESAEKTITICVDNAAPVINKILVKDAKQFVAAADTDEDDTYKYFLPSSAYDSSLSGYKATLEVTVQEAAGLLELSLGSDAYLTSTSTVSLKNAATNAAITAPYSVNTTDNKILFTEKGTAMCATGNFIVTITNVKIPETSSGVGSRTISVTAKDYALLSPENAFSTLSFEGDSDPYTEVWVDNSNSSPSDVTTFTVRGGFLDTDPVGYANGVTLTKTTLVLPSFGESGLKKIKFTGLKANKSTVGGTRVYRGTSTAGAGLDYETEDSGTTIVLDYPIVSSSAVTLTITNLELTSLTQGSNTLSAKYEYLAGWASAVKTTTVIYDTVAPVVGSSTESMKWIVNSSSTGTAGITGTATVNNQYLVIPVTETNSGVRKIRIEVEKENAEGTMAATTTASCENVSYVGYSSSTGTSTSGASTLNTSYWSVADNEITIVDPATYGKAGWYYIKGITISSAADAALEEGNYTLKVTVTDYAGNASDTKTIDISNDHTKPVVQKSWFEGIVNTALTPKRTYTTHSENNTLFVKFTENGSGVQKIVLDHISGRDPFIPDYPWSYCRAMGTTDSTKLYYSLDNGANFTEVACTKASNTTTFIYSLTVAEADAIKAPAGTDVVLKITGLAMNAPDCADKCAASVGVRLTDLAQNDSVYDSTNNPDTNKNLAAIAEDRDQADVHLENLTITDSGKVLQGGTLVDESGTIEPYEGYTNTPYVNIHAVMNEYVDLPYTAQSGLRAIVLEGATFTELTEIKWKELYRPSGANYWEWPGVNEKETVHYHGAELTGTYLGSKTSIAEVPFGFDTTGFYLVGDNTLVLETPVSVGNDGYVELSYVKLDGTNTDGTKNVKIKVYDVAGTQLKSDGTLDETINTSRPNADSTWPVEHERTKSIVYCGTAPTITVNDTAKSDPATITAANIQTLVPTTNGLQAYAEGTTVWTFSHSSQSNRKGSNSTLSGNGVYLYNSYCPYFDLDITPSTAANLSYYKWTNSDTVPASGWNSTSSNKVNVNFPTSGDVSADSVTAMDWYLHVADYAGNVTTKKMSQCQWINETVASAWPKRNSDGAAGKVMVDGAYYLESTDFYTTDIPKLTVTLPAGTSEDVKVYIPTNWFDKVCTNGAPIYGYAMGNHERYGEGHEDISKAKRDATGPYLEIPKSYITEANAESTKIAGFYFYVYDAVGQDLTAVVEVTVDSTPPWLEPTIVPETTGYIKWKDNAAYVYRTTSSTEGVDRFFAAHHYTDGSSTGKINVAWNGSLVGASNGSESNLTKGLTADNPLEFYTNSDIRVDLRATDNDILSYKYSVDGVTHTIADTLGTWDGSFYRQSIPSIAITDTPQTIRIYAVDKGSNTTDLYFRITKDTEGPAITASNVQNVNKITENVSGSDVTTNYFGSYATANVVVTDDLSGLASVNGSTSSSDITAYSTTGKSTNLASMTWKDGDAVSPDIPYSLTLAAVDNFGNSSSSSMDNGGCSRWVKDVTAPGTPSLTYGFALGAVNILANTLKSDYYNWGKDGLKVTQSSSTSWTVKFDPDHVTKITVEPSATDNSGGSGIMGYVILNSSTPASFYSKDDVDDSIDIFVSSITSTTYKYIFAVDKAGNPSSSYFTLNISPLAGKPDYTITSKDGIYTSGSSGWFKEGASVTVSATNSPDEYILQWGSDSDDSKTGTYSSTITIPNDADGGTELSLVLYNGRQSAEKYIENGTTTKTVSSWTLDNTAPTGISVSSVTASGTGGKVYKASSGTIYYNGTAESLTITPTATENSDGSGIAGYATSTTGTKASSVSVSTSGSPTSVTIYAFDNVGNYSSETFTLAKDTTAPTVGIVEGSMTGCTEIDGTLYYKDNTAKLQLSVTDSGSGVDESTGHLKNNEEILLSGYTGGGKLTITSGKIADKVGNTQAYELISNIIQDTEAPDAPTGITSVAATDGNSYLSGTTVFYSGSASAITLTLTGAGDSQSGLAGYTAGSITGVTSTATTVTIPVSGLSATQNVTIKAKDGVGNVSSTGLALVLKKDAEAPSVTRTYPSSGVVEVTLVPTNKIFFKGNPSVTLGITDSGSGIPATGSLQNGGTISLGTYYNADEHSLKIPADLIYDNVGNTDTYEFDSGKIYKDETAPSLSGTLSVSDSPYVGRASVGSSTQVTWFKTGTKVSISMCEDEGSGLAYWQIGTETTKQTTGTFVSGTSEGELTIPEITSPTTLYVYAEDRLGNSAYCKLSDINSAYAEKWCFNDGTAPAAPKGTAISSLTAKVGGTASSGYVFVNPAFDDTSTSYTVYYNGSASEMTVAMSSTLPTGVVGYSLSPTDLSSLGTTLTATLPVSDNTVKIFAVDYKGNVSTGLTLTLVKDDAAPTMGTPSVNTTMVPALIANPDNATDLRYTVNVAPADTQITIPLTDEGCGVAAYALYTSESDTGLPPDSLEWMNLDDTFTGSLVIAMPEINTPGINMILLLKDKVGNVTEKDATDNYKASILSVGGAGWWVRENVSNPSATYSTSGNDVTVNISGVLTAVSKIVVTTNADSTNTITGSAANFKYAAGTYEATSAASVSGGVATFTSKSLNDWGNTPRSAAISYDGTISLTITGATAAPGLTKIEVYKGGTVVATITSILSANTFSGFIRHNLPAIESLVDNSGRSGVIRRSYGAERAVDLATYFNALSSAREEKAEDTKIAFNIGRNMENGGIAEKTEKVVTTAEEGGYMDEASIAEKLPVQNHAWRAPDGFVSEETEAAGNQLLAQNAVVEFSSPNKVLTATDAALEDESGKNYEKWLALALSLLSVCALGLVVTLGRGRMKKNS